VTNVEILLLAIASAFWPLLIAVTVIALRCPNPPRLLSFFLAGSLLTTISIGVAIVLLLGDSDLVDRSRPPLDPILDFTVGGLMLLVAGVLARAQAQVDAHPKPPKPAAAGPSRTERALERGAPLAFVLGIVLNVLPGFLPFVALKDIAELNTGTAEVILIVACFYLVMFAFVEVPLVGYVLAPERTSVLTNELNAWVSANGRRVGSWAAAAVGVYLIVRGIVAVL
jgi:hypothetical protein